MVSVSSTDLRLTKKENKNIVFNTIQIIFKTVFHILVYFWYNTTQKRYNYNKEVQYTNIYIYKYKYKYKYK